MGWLCVGGFASGSHCVPSQYHLMEWMATKIPNRTHRRNMNAFDADSEG